MTNNDWMLWTHEPPKLAQSMGKQYARGNDESGHRDVVGLAMTPDALIEKYKSTVEEFRTFVSAQPQITDWHVCHIEAFIKLQQAGFALDKFRKYELALKTSGISHSDQVNDLRFYAEAFYYFAWRFSKVVRRVKARSKNARIVEPFKSFDPKGVRRARNHLIEHTDKAGGVPVLYFKFDCPEGLVLQYDATDAQGPLDRGLYPNADELISGIGQRIAAVRWE